MAKPIQHSPLPPDGVDHTTRPKGAKKGPRYKIFAAPWHETKHATPPAEVVVIPPHMSMEGNADYGDCVTAEEAAAKAAYSIYCGLPETYIPDANTIAWAQKYGWLNGAELTPVMDQMAIDGLNDATGKDFKDGPWKVVDFTDEVNLKDSLTVGPVKIGIDASALSPGAGNGNGWWSTGGSPGEFANEDHCVSIFGYCKASTFFAHPLVNKPLPAHVDPNTVGYILYTWGGVGFVDHDWIMSTCQESYVRNPTTLGQTPPTPVPPVPPVPPIPPVPPVPPTPPMKLVTTIPDRTTSFHHWALGTVPVPLPGGTFPVTSISSADGVAMNWLKIIPDIEKLVADGAAILPEVKAVFADIQAGNWSGTLQDAIKVIADIGPIVADVEAIIADIRG